MQPNNTRNDPLTDASPLKDRSSLASVENNNHAFDVADSAYNTNEPILNKNAVINGASTTTPKIEFTATETLMNCNTKQNRTEEDVSPTASNILTAALGEGSLTKVVPILPKLIKPAKNPMNIIEVE